MALVSHLDLIRLFDRAVRRAAGFLHRWISSWSPYFYCPGTASGVTSCGEIMDFEVDQGRYRDFPATAKQSVAGRYTDLQCGKC